MKHHDSVSANDTARLESPLYTTHTNYRCLQFWYIYEGRDQGKHIRNMTVSAYSIYDSMCDFLNSQSNIV